MPSEKQPSIYDFLKGKFTFTDEPLWFRLVLCVLGLATIIAIIWALHRWALPTILAWHVVPKISGLVNGPLGRSP